LEKGIGICFELNKRNLSFLKLNSGLNSCKKIKIINACVCDRVGIVDFNSGPDSTMGHIGKGEFKIIQVGFR